MERIILQIEKIITWYQNNYSNANIDNLMDAKSKLVTLNYNLADLLATAKSNYNSRYYIRKIAITQAKNALIRNKEAISKATSFAEEQEIDKLDEELKAESLAYSIEIKLKQSNMIINDLTQRISILRKEAENTDYYESK